MVIEVAVHVDPIVESCFNSMQNFSSFQQSTKECLMSPWIDFKELRANLNFEDVLRHYGVEVKRRGEQHHGFCPLPNHDGKKNSPSFSANLTRGIFQCFGCKAKGNILDFAALMERVDPNNSVAFRDVALRLRAKFCPGSGAERKTANQ